MLLFENEEVNFKYIENSHLKGFIKMTNHSQMYANFKFKITRPKYYMIKPDKGYIEPKQSIKIEVTLHKNGIDKAKSDKIKCFSRMHSTVIPINRQFQKSSEIMSKKLIINIENLPLQMQKMCENASEVKSLRNSDNLNNFRSSQNSTTLQGSIKDKQSKIADLRHKLSMISTIKQNQSQQRTSSKYWAIIGVTGLVLGFVSSFWF